MARGTGISNPLFGKRNPVRNPKAEALAIKEQQEVQAKQAALQAKRQETEEHIALGGTIEPGSHHGFVYDEVWRDAQGNLNRSKGPALVSDKNKEWYLHGRLHRTDGPAKQIDEYEAWFFAGYLHKPDGPCEKGSGLGSYFLCGRGATEDHILELDPLITKRWERKVLDDIKTQNPDSKDPRLDKLSF